MQSSTNANQSAGSAPGNARNMNEPTTSSSTSAHSESPQADKERAQWTGKNSKQPRQPRQPQSRFWNKVRESWKVLVRALSLSLVVHAFRGLRHPTGRGLHEPTKVAIRQSRLAALLRNLVHLVPFGFALFEIILNWNVYYVGTQPYSTAIYQVVAKAHEVLVQASITTIIFSAIRRDLAHGKGLPFGLLFSGLQVSQISYLWSVELWGAIRADFQRPLRKLALFSLVVGGIALAVASGPSSALLLIPRVQLWPAGRTHIWINVTADQLWPAQVDGNLVSNDCSIVGTAISDACPASEWYVIANRLSGERRAVLPSYADRLGAAPSPISSTLQGKTSQRELLCAEQTFPDEQFAAEMCTTQQAVVCDALVSTSALWARSLTNVTAKTGHGSPLSDQSDSSHTIAENYSQPYSDALCLPDRVQNFSDSRPVALPLLPMANSPDLATGNLTYKPGYTARTIRHPGLLYHHLLNTPGDAQEYRIRWIELPGNLFNGSSIGAAILLPPPQATTEPNVLLCNIAAGWGSAYLALENSNFGYSSANSKIRYGADFDIARVPMDIGYAPRAESEAGVDSLVFKYPYYPQRPVNISQSWARYLNPMIEGSNTTVVNSLMQQQIFPENPSTTARGMLASLIVNGLARTGWEGFLQGEVRTAGANGQGGLDGNYWLSGKGDVFKVDPEVSQEWVTLRVDSTLQGYAYNTLTTPPRIAIAIMTAYCLLVVGHTLYSGITGISSNAWDTIAEVTALAINSTPTAALRNTCAGISEMHIFKLPVRILVSKDEEGEGEHLELVFGKVDEEKMEERTIKSNRAYGTLPRGVKGEGKKEV